MLGEGGCPRCGKFLGTPFPVSLVSRRVQGGVYTRLFARDVLLQTSGIATVLCNQSDKSGYVFFYKYLIVFSKSKIRVYEVLITLVK